MITLDSHSGITLGESFITKYGLPVYVVVNKRGRKKYFSGETGYTDAQREFNDLVLKEVYK